ncbi:MAG: hypothetical protein RQ824_05425 [bacterium]|nr:hypothetical protein [bacterium]
MTSSISPRLLTSRPIWRPISLDISVMNLASSVEITDSAGILRRKILSRAFI